MKTSQDRGSAGRAADVVNVRQALRIRHTGVAAVGGRGELEGFDRRCADVEASLPRMLNSREVTVFNLHFLKIQIIHVR